MSQTRLLAITLLTRALCLVAVLSPLDLAHAKVDITHYKEWYWTKKLINGNFKSYTYSTNATNVQAAIIFPSDGRCHAPSMQLIGSNDRPININRASLTIGKLRRNLPADDLSFVQHIKLDQELLWAFKKSNKMLISVDDENYRFSLAGSAAAINAVGKFCKTLTAKTQPLEKNVVPGTLTETTPALEKNVDPKTRNMTTQSLENDVDTETLSKTTTTLKSDVNLEKNDNKEPTEPELSLNLIFAVSAIVLLVLTIVVARLKTRPPIDSNSSIEWSQDTIEQAESTQEEPVSLTVSTKNRRFEQEKVKALGRRRQILDWRDKHIMLVEEHFLQQIPSLLQRISKEIDRLSTNIRTLAVFCEQVEKSTNEIYKQWLDDEIKFVIHNAEKDLGTRIQDAVSLRNTSSETKARINYDARRDSKVSAASVLAGAAAIPATVTLSATTVPAAGLMGFLGVTATVISLPVVIAGGAVAVGLLGYGGRRALKRKESAVKHYKEALSKTIKEQVIGARNDPPSNAPSSNSSSSVCNRIEEWIKQSANVALSKVEI